MKIRVHQGRVNSTVSVVVSTTDWTRCELDAIIRFGEPQIDLGGVFLRKTPECMCGVKPLRPSDVNGRIEGFLDGLDRISEGDIDSGDGIQKTLLDLKAAASGIPQYSHEDAEENPDCFFELPENVRGVRREFPVLEKFPDDMYDDPESCAKWWSDEVVRRIADAMRRLKIMAASELSREEVYEV